MVKQMKWHKSIHSEYDRILDGPLLYYKASSIVLKAQDTSPEYVTENLMGELVDIVFGFTGSWNQFSQTTAPYRLEFTGLSPWSHGFTVTPPAVPNTPYVPCGVVSASSLSSPQQKKKERCYWGQILKLIYLLQHL